MNLEFSASAVQDLIRLREFIAIHDPEVAARISVRLRQTIAKLVLYPMLGRVVPTFENVRELVAGHYVVRYTVTDDTVFILRIWHGREYRQA